MDRMQQNRLHVRGGAQSSSGLGRSRQRHSGADTQNGFNKQNLQRWIPAIAGGALAIYGLSRRSKGGMLLAGGAAALAYQGTKAASPRHNFARASVLVNAQPDKVFQFWRRFENLPQFMHHLETVTDLGNGRSRWVAIGPVGSRIQWDAQIISERSNEYIAWRSTPESAVQVDGTVEFRPAPAGRGTYVDVTMEYMPPGQALGRSFMKMLGKDPSFLIRQDLRRFKALLETGEIPTVEGQSHGPRSAVAAVARIADPDQPFAKNVGAKDLLNAKRRVS